MTEILRNIHIHSLESLAADIRAEVEAAEADYRSAVDHAIKAGELLIEAKAQVKHGEWLPWLQTNCPLGERQAQRYMELARNPSRVSGLGSVREAIAMLTEPKTTTISVQHAPRECIVLGCTRPAKPGRNLCAECAVLAPPKEPKREAEVIPLRMEVAGGEVVDGEPVDDPHHPALDAPLPLPWAWIERLRAVVEEAESADGIPRDLLRPARPLIERLTRALGEELRADGY